MRAYLEFLRRHPVWWLTPIAGYVVALAWVASRLVRTPENPFAYAAW